MLVKITNNSHAHVTWVSVFHPSRSQWFCCITSPCIFLFQATHSKSDALLNHVESSFPTLPCMQMACTGHSLDGDMWIHSLAFCVHNITRIGIHFKNNTKVALTGFNSQKVGLTPKFRCTYAMNNLHSWQLFLFYFKRKPESKMIEMKKRWQASWILSCYSSIQLQWEPNLELLWWWIKYKCPRQLGN